MPRNRSFPPHLEIRRLGFYWRRRLSRSLSGPNADPALSPGHVASPGPRKMFLCFSLRTHVMRDAKILARRLTEMSDLVFDADAEMTMSIAPETQVQILESLARFEIEAFERLRAHAGPRSPRSARIKWSSLNVNAGSVSGLSGRCFRGLVDGIPERCAA